MRYTTTKKIRRKRAFSIDIPEILKDYAGVISAVVAFSNFCLASVIFKFNRKTSQSKLSVNTSIRSEFEPKFSNDIELDYTFNLDHLHWFDAVKGLPETYLVIPDERFASKNLIMTLNNKGELASTNIKVILEFRGYGTKIPKKTNFIGKIISSYKIEFNKKIQPYFKRDLFHTEKIIVELPYMGADSNKNFSITLLRGQFREVELLLKKIEANGHTYFKGKNVVISHYEHPYLRGSTSTDEYIKLIGVNNPDKNLEFYTHTRITYKGVLKWVRSLFAEWRK